MSDNSSANPGGTESLPVRSQKKSGCEQGPPSGERILVVDDEDLVRMVIRAILNFRGYRVTEAPNGEDAVVRYLQTPGGFDLVVIDLNMPRLNGREALGLIRQADPGVRAILLSGGVEEVEVEAARRLGGVEFLQKPFENDELLQLVHFCISAGRMGGGLRPEPT